MSKAFFALCSLLAVSGSAFADEPKKDVPDRVITGFEAADEAQPLWEFGVGGGVGEVPNYPASSERNFIALAAPYIIYRGDVFRIGGGGGARAVVAEDDKWELDLFSGWCLFCRHGRKLCQSGYARTGFLVRSGSANCLLGP